MTKNTPAALLLDAKCSFNDELTWLDYILGQLDCLQIFPDEPLGATRTVKEIVIARLTRRLHSPHYNVTEEWADRLIASLEFIYKKVNGLLVGDYYQETFGNGDIEVDPVSLKWVH